MKKLISVLLVLTMCMSLAVNAFAADSAEPTDGAVMKTYTYNSIDDFHQPEYQGIMNNIYFLDSLDAFPERITYIDIFDLSEKGDNSVVGKIARGTGANMNTFDLYIAANGKVYANEDSSYLFADTGVNNIIGYENFDTSNVVSMKAMFRDSDIETFDFDDIDTSKVIDMSFMFQDSDRLKSVTGKADAIRISDMNNMFNDCTALTSFDVAIDFSSVSSSNDGIKYMFKNCSALKTVDLSKCTGTNRISSLDAFQDCVSLESVNFSNWSFIGISDMSSTFTGCSSLKDVYLYDVTDIRLKYTGSAATNGGVSGLVIHTDDVDFLKTNLWSYFSATADSYIDYDGIDLDNNITVEFLKNDLDDHYTVNGDFLYEGTTMPYHIGTVLTVNLPGAKVFNVNGKSVYADNGTVKIYLTPGAQADENSYVLESGEKHIRIGIQTVLDKQTIPDSTASKIILTIRQFFIDTFNFFNSIFNVNFDGIFKGFGVG